jgi:hypothetical protein
MSHRLRLTFSDAMRQSEFETAVELIETCGTTQDTGQPRTLTVVAYPGQLDVLKRFLSVWESDGLLTTADAT